MMRLAKLGNRATRWQQYASDHYWVFDTGNDPDITTALIAGFDIDKVN